MTEAEKHHRSLEHMYLSAPINVDIYKGITIRVSEGRAELGLKVEPKFFHAASAIHGSVYFKMLDDAAFFAVNSVVTGIFVYTVSFNVQLLRPVTGGTVRAVGELKFSSANLFVADSVMYDEHNKVVGRGTGSFMKSKIPLTEEIGYKL